MHLEGNRFPRSGTMHLSLGTPLRRVAFLVVFGLLAAIYVARTSSWVRANWLIRKNPTDVFRALKLEPADPKLQSLAGLAKFGEGDWQGALAHLTKAAQQDQYDARNWLNLAMVYQVMDQTTEQEQALRRALSSDPRTPQIAWEVGNFELARGNPDAAFAQFRTVIESDPFLVPAAISTVWRFTHDYKTVASLLPNTVAPWEELLRVMIAADELGNAQQAWESLVKLHQPLNSTTAVELANFLLKRHEYVRAEVVWRQFTSNSRFSGHSKADNLIVNGSFDEDVLNGGLDWRFESAAGTDVSLDTGSAHDGSRALLISFTENAEGDPGLFQYVPVEPDTTYQFSAFLRGEEIYTTNGPRFTVSDSENGTAYLVSAPLIGTTAWTQVNGVFKTTSDSHLLKIGISRDQPTLIRGRLWVDEVSLVKR